MFLFILPSIQYTVKICTVIHIEYLDKKHLTFSRI